MKLTQFAPKALMMSLFFITYTSHASVVHTPSQTNTPLPQLDSLQNNKPLELTIPNMQRFHTENGVATIFTQLKELPIVDISISFKGGSAKDDTIKENGYGIAGMTATMMTQGTTQMDENAFAQAAELLGPSFGATARRDVFTYNFRSLSDKEQLEPALALFTQMIDSPRFDPDILKRNQNRAMVGFTAKQEDPSYLGRQAFFGAIYGTHPYAHFSEGTAKSVSAITRDDLIAYKNKFLVADNAHISITGDLSLDQAKKIANRLSAILPKGQKASNLSTPTTPKAVHIHLPYDSSQTHIFIGHLGEKNTKDPALLQEYTNFNLGNSVLAGSDFNAHLMKEIRDKGGYTYGITGGMTTYDEHGYYLINFSTQTDKATQAITKTLNTIHQTLSSGISQAELELEKNSRKYAYPMSLSTNRAIHATATHLNYQNLPDSHISDYLVRLDNAHLNDVNQALKRYIRPNEFVIVTIGKDKPNLAHITPDSQTIAPAGE